MLIIDFHEVAQHFTELVDVCMEQGLEPGCVFDMLAIHLEHDGLHEEGIAACASEVGVWLSGGDYTDLQIADAMYSVKIIGEYMYHRFKWSGFYDHTGQMADMRFYQWRVNFVAIFTSDPHCEID